MHKLLRLVTYVVINEAIIYIYIYIYIAMYILFLLLGNHVVYNLQASSDDDKKNWIKFFQQVIKHMY